MNCKNLVLRKEKIDGFTILDKSLFDFTLNENVVAS